MNSIGWNNKLRFCYLNDAKYHSNSLKFWCQVRVSPKPCEQMKNFLKSCSREWSTATLNTICIVQEFLARIKCWVEFVILWRTKIFLTWEKLEDYSNLEKRLLLVDSRSNRVSRVESELLQAKQRPFWFNESRRNQQLRRKNRESSVNLLLNGTVQIICWAPWISQVQSTGSRQFFLEHSLGMSNLSWSCARNKSQWTYFIYIRRVARFHIFLRPVTFLSFIWILWLK